MISEEQLRTNVDSIQRFCSILADRRYRQLVSLLVETSRPLRPFVLAHHIAAREADVHPSEVTEQQRTDVLVDLQHRCIPKLERDGWISQYPDGIVTTQTFDTFCADSAVFTDTCLRWETLAVVLLSPHRLQTLSILAGRDHPLPLEELVAKLRENDSNGWYPERRDEDVDIGTTLHHRDLPRLETIGLVEYDRAEKLLRPQPAFDGLAEQIEALGSELESFDPVS